MTDLETRKRICEGLQKKWAFEEAQALAKKEADEALRAKGQEILRERLARPDVKVVNEGTDDEETVWLQDHSTNWGKPIARPPQPNMMGQGVGNCLGLEASKATRWENSAEVRKREESERIEKAKRKEERGRRRAMIKEAAEVFAIVRPLIEAHRIQKGEVMVGQRVFRCKFFHENFTTRAKQLGVEIPKGVDVALTPFGGLLVVPVLEDKFDQARSEYIKDTDGRRFQVAAEIKDKVSQIFGCVDWSRPLSTKETKEFGVVLD